MNTETICIQLYIVSVFIDKAKCSTIILNLNDLSNEIAYLPQIDLREI